MTSVRRPQRRGRSKQLDCGEACRALHLGQAREVNTNSHRSCCNRTRMAPANPSPQSNHEGDKQTNSKRGHPTTSPTSAPQRQDPPKQGKSVKMAWQGEPEAQLDVTWYPAGDPGTRKGHQAYDLPLEDPGSLEGTESPILTSNFKICYRRWYSSPYLASFSSF